MDIDPKDICFAKAGDNSLECLHSLHLRKFSWHSPKENIRAKFSKVTTVSNTRFALINCKESGDKGLTSFI